MKRLFLPLLALLALLGLVSLGGCGSSTDSASDASPSVDSTAGSTPTSEAPSPSEPDLTGTVTVLAAASLTQPFTDLATAFEAQHPGVTVEISFGSSTTLAQQIAQGAPADLYASAGTKAFEQLPEDAKAKPQAIIAKNVLEIAAAPGNPKGLTGGLSALSDQSLDVVLCAETVPCGSAADSVLAKAGITPNVVSREVDVKATLAKVTLGEADAAVVYHSDVVGAGDKVAGVEIPTDQNTTLDYPLVTLTDTPAAKAFAAFLAGPEGLKALTAAGLLAP